jgi:hypothetical protein
MFPDGLLGIFHGRSRVRSCRRNVISALAFALLAPLGAAFAGRAWGGCAVPEPELWLPVGEGAAPPNSRVTFSLGGMMGLVRGVELRVLGGSQPIAVERRELPGPMGQQVFELRPHAPLAPDTDYELVARRPKGWHPSQWIFGVFRTSPRRDDVAPVLGVVGARFLRGAPEGTAKEWVELDVVLRDGDRTGGAALYAVWFPGESGSLDSSAPPDVYLPGQGDTLRISSPEVCPGSFVPLPSTPGRLEIGVAAFDAAGNRSPVQRVALEVPPLPPRGGR